MTHQLSWGNENANIIFMSGCIRADGAEFYPARSGQDPLAPPCHARHILGKLYNQPEQAGGQEKEKEKNPKSRNPSQCARQLLFTKQACLGLPCWKLPSEGS